MPLALLPQVDQPPAGSSIAAFNIGTATATIPMLIVVGAGISLPPLFSPLKRRAPIQQADHRRRGVVQDDTIRRIADEHQDELRPPR